MTWILVLLHRWLGVFLCLFFAMWFASGAIMMYVPFPSLSDKDRLGYLEPIDALKITVSPAEALELCGSLDIRRLRLISLADRPVYVCHTADQQLRLTRADALAAALPLSPQQAVSIARADASLAAVTGDPIHYDQWIVHQKFDAYRPFFRVELEDEAGTNLYVATRTGEVLQRTTHKSRLWNYPGAVAHWIYPTILRKNWVRWDQIVWWLSLFGVVCAAAGVYLGVMRMTTALGERAWEFSGFRGWLRWHHVVGLFSGIFALSWIFSGWLSMDHGRLFSSPVASEDQVRAVQGLSVHEIAERITAEELRNYPGAREIVFHAFGGFEFLQAKDEQGPLDARVLSASEIGAVIGRVWQGASVVSQGVVPQRDTYTHLREGRLPEGTIRIKLADAGETWLHIDPSSGEILSVMDRSRRVYRWLFNGFHSLDVPGLVERRPLWDGVMLLLLCAGFFGSLTGIVISIKRLRKTFTS